MSVGTGSMKRAAARVSATAETPKTETTAKKTVNRRTRKTVTKVVEAAEMTQVEEMINPVNEACHLTEELPIHLL